MKKEFSRFGLADHRLLVGYLQILGGVGLLIGIFVSAPLALFCATGLFMLMVMGVMVRIRLRDHPILIMPAIILGILNLGIAWAWLQMSAS